MTTMTPSKFGYFLAGGCVAAAAFFFGAAQAPSVHAQDAVAPPKNEAAESEPFGVSIPSGGSALVKGKDGFAYIVDSRGVYVRAAQSGKALELP